MQASTRVAFFPLSCLLLCQSKGPSTLPSHSNGGCLCLLTANYAAACAHVDAEALAAASILNSPEKWHCASAASGTNHNATATKPSLHTKLGRPWIMTAPSRALTHKQSWCSCWPHCIESSALQMWGQCCHVTGGAQSQALLKCCNPPPFYRVLVE